MVIVRVWHFLFILYISSKFRCLEASFTKFANDLPDIASLCPHRQFCYGTVAKNISIDGMDSCCQVCSCAPDCHMVGGCCPDVQHTVLTPPIYPCRQVTDILNTVRNVSFAQHDRRMYRFIDSCPDKNTSENFPACERPIKLQDYVIVSGKDNTKVFKNKHCSMCHGVVDFNEWEITSQCHDIAVSDFQTFEERDEYILQKCAMNSYPPNKIIGEFSRCFHRKETIDNCQDNVSKTKYGNMLKTACDEENLSYNTAFFMDDIWKQRVYKNVFCYLCSQPENVVMSDVCTSRQYKPVEKNYFLVTFSAVLAPLRDLSSQEASIYSKCESTHVWDSFVRQCTKLFCPTGKIPAYGKCMSSTQSTFGFSLATRFEVILKGPQPTEREILILLDNLIPILFSREHRCGICERKFYKQVSRQKLYVEISLFTTMNCSIDKILSSLKTFARMKKKTFSVKYMGEVRHLIMKHIPEDIINKTYLPNGFSDNHKQCNNEIQTDIHMLQNCPRILTPSSIFLEITRNDVTVFKHMIRELLAIINSDNQTVFICVDEYFRLTALLSSSGEFFLYNTCVLVIFLHFFLTL